MKPDLDYTRKLLEAFEASGSWWSDVEDLERAGIAADDVLAFHLLLLQDHGAVAAVDPVSGLGVQEVHGQTLLIPVPIRMTARGHEFLAALQEPKALAAARSSLGAGLGVAMEVGKAALIAWAMHRLQRWPDQTGLRW